MKKILSLLLSLLLLVGLAGCESAPKIDDAAFTKDSLDKSGTKSVETRNAYATYVETVAKLQAANVMKLDLPLPDGRNLKLEIPMGQNGMVLQPPTPAPVPPSTAAIVSAGFFDLAKTVVGQTPFVVGAGAIKSIFNKFGDTTAAISKNIQAPAGTTINVTGSQGVGIGGQGSYAPVTNTTTTTTTTTNEWNLALQCSFAIQTNGSLPAYCSQQK